MSPLSAYIYGAGGVLFTNRAEVFRCYFASSGNSSSGSDPRLALLGEYGGLLQIPGDITKYLFAVQSVVVALYVPIMHTYLARLADNR